MLLIYGTEPLFKPVFMKCGLNFYELFLLVIIERISFSKMLIIKLSVEMAPIEAAGVKQHRNAFDFGVQRKAMAQLYFCLCRKWR